MSLLLALALWALWLSGSLALWLSGFSGLSGLSGSLGFLVLWLFGSLALWFSAFSRQWSSAIRNSSQRSTLRAGSGNGVKYQSKSRSRGLSPLRRRCSAASSTKRKRGNPDPRTGATPPQLSCTCRRCRQELSSLASPHQS